MNIEEFEELMENIELRGFGGTDFRPVFDYVDSLTQKGEFENLKGLIYFTDGYGVFPEKKPGYDTAFIFIDDEFGQPEIPVWAIKLVLAKTHMFMARFLLPLSFIIPLNTIKEKRKKNI